MDAWWQMDRTRRSKIMLTLIFGAVILFSGIWFRDVQVISMLSIILGGLLLVKAFLDSFLLLIYKEPEVLEQYVGTLSPDGTPSKDAIQRDTSERSLVDCGGRDKLM